MEKNKFIEKGKYSYYDSSIDLRRYGNQKNKLYIGNFCSISKNLTVFLGGNHRTDWVTTFPFNVLWDSAKHIKGHPSTKGDVIIKNDVWIGENVTILSGITIENGAVIGANSVVARNVEPYSIVAGNPIKLINKRFSYKQIDNLLKIQWWNWDDDKIKKFIPLLLNDDIDEFIRRSI